MLESLEHVGRHQVDPVPVQSKFQQLTLVLERAGLHRGDGVVLEEEEEHKMVIALELQLLQLMLLCNTLKLLQFILGVVFFVLIISCRNVFFKQSKIWKVAHLSVCPSIHHIL